MSGLDQPALPPMMSPQALSRRGGLIGWGVLLITIGTVVALACISLLMSRIEGFEQSLSRQPWVSVTAFDISWKGLVIEVFTLALSGGIVWMGIAACIGRRWTRPAVMVLSGFIIAVGLLNFVAMSLSVPFLVNSAATMMDRNDMGAMLPSSILMIYGIRAALLLGGVVVLPYFLYRFFASPLTRQLLETLDSQPSWVDGRPVPVLGWAAFCAMGSLGALLQIDQPAFPVFTFVLGGFPALICLIIGFVILAWGAWLCFRLERIGWLLTSSLVSIVHISGVVFFWRGGMLSDLLPQSKAIPLNIHASAGPPAWFVPTMVTLEAALVLAFGVYVSLSFSRMRMRVA